METEEVAGEVEEEVEEVEVVSHVLVADASTQTRMRKRKGGRRSRLRRLLAFQLHLTVDKGLPLSHLLTKGTEAKSPRRRREQEESASPTLRRRVEGKEGVDQVGEVEEEMEELKTGDQAEEGREQVVDTKKGALSSCSMNLFKLSSPTTGVTTSPQISTPAPTLPKQAHGYLPSSHLPPPYPPPLTRPCTPAYTPLCTLAP